MLPLEVSTEHLTISSASLTAIQAALSSAIADGSAPCSPLPAAVDSVSNTAAGAFTAFAAEFLSIVHDGLSKLADGAAALVPISMEYEASDLSNAGSVQSTAAGFA
ncbi:PE domain-containing protein [Nocardia sp. NPDC050793]|uniref:PE domain-containing protein n=1 Tax=Nocardia sp. NPDC050793 TaxID=3155159 RepID=UPI0033CFFF6A